MEASVVGSFGVSGGGGWTVVGIRVWVAAAKVEVAIFVRMARAGRGKSFFISLRSSRLTALSRPIIAPLPFFNSPKNSPHHGRIFVRVRSNRVGLSSPASSRSLRCEMISWCGIDRSSLRLLVPYATSTTASMRCPSSSRRIYHQFMIYLPFRFRAFRAA
jgi:hypothetical protein